MNKARANYWIDLATGLALVFSAISGLVLWLPGDPAAGVLGISLRAWNSVHAWSRVAMVAGVGVHLVLHWKWTVAMTRRFLFPETRLPAGEPALGEASSTRLSRRYRDSNGDSICDYSVPGSGTNLSTGQGGEWPGRTRPRYSDEGWQ